MNIVTRNGFGRTILCTIAVIPIENSNHIGWVLQMCLRHGLDLKCAIFTNQGPMLPATALFNKKNQILLKLQLCLQHMIRCIRRLHPALFRTRKDNSRSSPASGANKSKTNKNHGNSNNNIVRSMVHRASYASSCEQFINIIYESIQKLALQNHALVGDVMDVGMYLLEFHPHLWTSVSVANASNFSETDYLERLKPVYYEFLLTKLIYQPNPENNNVISNMNTKGVENHLRMAQGVARRGVETFEFHNITSNATPAPRFNNSSTNISELIAWIMKSNGSRWLTVPQFVRQCIHLYNYQILQMIQDFLRFQNLTLTSIGYSIIWSHTTEYQEIVLV